MSATLFVREDLEADPKRRDYELVCPHGKTSAATPALLRLRHLVQHHCGCVQYQWHRGAVSVDSLGHREVVRLIDDACLIPV